MDNYKCNYRPAQSCRIPAYQEADPFCQGACQMPYTDRENCKIENMPIAMAYVPWQQWREIYEPCKILMAGTIFRELDLPFLERSCMTR